MLIKFNGSWSTDFLFYRFVPDPIFGGLVGETGIRGKRFGEVVDGDVTVTEKNGRDEALAGVSRIFNIGPAKIMVPLIPVRNIVPRLAGWNLAGQCWIKVKTGIRPSGRFVHKNIAGRVGNPTFALEREWPGRSLPLAAHQHAAVIMITGTDGREIRGLVGYFQWLFA